MNETLNLDEIKNYSLLLRKEQIEQFRKIVKPFQDVSIENEKHNENGLTLLSLRLQSDNLPTIFFLRYRLDNIQASFLTK